MIPYVELPSLHFGFLQLNAFNVLTALGIWTGAQLAARAARRYQPGDDRPLVEAAPWLIVGGLVGAHLLHIFGYHPEIFARDGWPAVFRLWEGLSSMGGVLGGLITLNLFFRAKGWRVLPHANAMALGVAPGWAIARLGCFAVHDHPGSLTSFPLAVAFPDGARHDLGLYEAALLGVLTLVLYLLARKPRPEGFLMGILAVGYSLPRFFLDFLRADDLPFVDGRILGFTPAQYLSVLWLSLGLWLLLRLRGLGAKAEDGRDGERAEPASALPST